MSCNQRTVESASESYATDAYDVGPDTPVMVAASDPWRRSVTVIVDRDAASDAYLVTGPAGTVGRGLRLVPGASWTMNTSAAVYLRTLTGTVRAYVVTESGEVG